tara:strand:+ start:744 stop:1148 length:405 start_codon:yes stop_codon:yes gene_type:complete
VSIESSSEGTRRRQSSERANERSIEIQTRARRELKKNEKMTRGRRPGARLDGLGVRRRGFQEVAAAEVVVAFILERGEVVRERRDRVGGTHRDGRAKECRSLRLFSGSNRRFFVERGGAGRGRGNKQNAVVAGR